MAAQVLQIIQHGFITGNTTLSFEFQYFKEGEVHGVTAYPTDGVPGIRLQVQNLHYRKFVQPNFNWVWIMGFDLVNLDGNGVVFDAFIGIIS